MGRKSLHVQHLFSNVKLTLVLYLILTMSCAAPAEAYIIGYVPQAINPFQKKKDNFWSDLPMNSFIFLNIIILLEKVVG